MRGLHGHTITQTPKKVWPLFIRYLNIFTNESSVLQFYEVVDGKATYREPLNKGGLMHLDIPHHVACANEVVQ